MIGRSKSFCQIGSSFSALTEVDGFVCCRIKPEEMFGQNRAAINFIVVPSGDWNTVFVNCNHGVFLIDLCALADFMNALFKYADHGFIVECGMEVCFLFLQLVAQGVDVLPGGRLVALQVGVEKGRRWSSSRSRQLSR